MASTKAAADVNKLAGKSDQELLSMRNTLASQIGQNETGLGRRGFQIGKAATVGAAAGWGMSALANKIKDVKFIGGISKIPKLGWIAGTLAAVGSFVYINNNHKRDETAQITERLQNIEIELQARAAQRSQQPAYGSDISQADLDAMNAAMQNRQAVGKSTSQVLANAGQGQRGIA